MSIHIARNLKGGLEATCSLLSTNKKGWWSDFALGKTEQATLVQSSRKFELQITRSSQILIQLQPVLPFIQVNLAPLLQLWVRLWKLDQLEKSSQVAFKGSKPPCFSWGLKIALKSPMKIQAPREVVWRSFSTCQSFHLLVQLVEP